MVVCDDDLIEFSGVWMNVWLLDGSDFEWCSTKGENHLLFYYIDLVVVYFSLLCFFCYIRSMYTWSIILVTNYWFLLIAGLPATNEHKQRMWQVIYCVRACGIYVP
jgi:hypothetical protein